MEHHKEKRAGKKRACFTNDIWCGQSLGIKSRSGERRETRLGQDPDSRSGYAETKVLEFSLRTNREQSSDFLGFVFRTMTELDSAEKAGPLTHPRYIFILSLQ